MTENISQILERIRKLNAKATAEGTTEAEAAAFAAKVQELLAEHSLSLVDLGGEEETAPIGQESMSTMYDDPWRRWIARSAARLYFCDMHLTDRLERDERTGKTRIRPAFAFVGRPHNRAIAMSMAQYLIDTTLRLARAYSTDRAARLGFERGCGVRLGERLDEMREKSRAAEPPRKTQSGGAANLPALYQTEEVLVEEFKKNLGLRKFGRGTSTGGRHGAAGRGAAEGVSLSPQVGGAAGRALPRR